MYLRLLAAENLLQLDKYFISYEYGTTLIRHSCSNFKITSCSLLQNP